MAGFFSYGDAVFHGSAGSMTLSKPIVGMATTSDEGGYWLLGGDGGIFTYGDASYLGNGLASSCSGGVPVECVVAASGCTVTQNAVACGAGDTCAHGTCQASCTDACASGASRCSGAEIEVCGHYGSVPCNTWSTAAACPSGQSCTGGVCASPACSDDCESGATKCQGDDLVACTGTTTGGCRTWGMPTACQYGQTCQAGGCVTTPDGGVPGKDAGKDGADAGSHGSGSGSGHESGSETGSASRSSGKRSDGGAPAGSADAGADGSTQPGQADTGCSCTTASRRTGDTPWSTGVLAGVVGLALRRRRRGGVVGR